MHKHKDLISVDALSYLKSKNDIKKFRLLCSILFYMTETKYVFSHFDCSLEFFWTSCKGENVNV